MNNTKIKITGIPIGSWDLQGNWFYNQNLNMTYQEQYQHNLIGGHFNRIKPSDLMFICVCDDKKESIFKRIYNCIFNG